MKGLAKQAGATKGERMAQEMREQLSGGMVAVKAGTAGQTLVSKAEAERNTKLAAAREAQRALDQEADKDAQPVKSKKAVKRIPAVLNMVETKKAEKAAAPALSNLNETKKAARVKSSQQAVETAPAQETKHCNRCGKDYPATTEFWASDKSAKSGLYYIDKQCERAARQAKLAMAAMPAPVKKAGKKGGIKKATK
jgi:hypothetical protein